MEIIELMNKQSVLESEAAAIDREYPPEDKEANQRYETAMKEVDALETQICGMVKDIVDNPSLKWSQSAEDFADAINKAAENGKPIEEVLFGKDSILDPTMVSCSFKLFRSEEGPVVMGGELTAQCKKFPWLLVKVSEMCVDVQAVWEISHRDYERPVLQGPASFGFHTGGFYQRALVGFFRREYVRRQCPE